jgi:hypothetical protein
LALHLETVVFVIDENLGLESCLVSFLDWFYDRGAAAKEILSGTARLWLERLFKVLEGCWFASAVNILLVFLLSGNAKDRRAATNTGVSTYVRELV